MFCFDWAIRVCRWLDRFAQIYQCPCSWLSILCKIKFQYNKLLQENYMISPSRLILISDQCFCPFSCSLVRFYDCKLKACHWRISLIWHHTLRKPKEFHREIKSVTNKTLIFFTENSKAWHLKYIYIYIYIIIYMYIYYIILYIYTHMSPMHNVSKASQAKNWWFLFRHVLIRSMPYNKALTHHHFLAA